MLYGDLDTQRDHHVAEFVLTRRAYRSQRKVIVLPFAVRDDVVFQFHREMRWWWKYTIGVMVLSHDASSASRQHERDAARDLNYSVTVTMTYPVTSPGLGPNFMSSRRPSIPRPPPSPLRPGSPPVNPSPLNSQTPSTGTLLSARRATPTSPPKTRARDLLRKHYGLGVGLPPARPGVPNDPMNMGASLILTVRSILTYMNRFACV